MVQNRSNNEGEAVVIDYPDGFLSEVCYKWAEMSLIDIGNSVVCLRTGVVLNQMVVTDENVSRI